MKWQLRYAAFHLRSTQCLLSIFSFFLFFFVTVLKYTAWRHYCPSIYTWHCTRIILMRIYCLALVRFCHFNGSAYFVCVKDFSYFCCALPISNGLALFVWVPLVNLNFILSEKSKSSLSRRPTVDLSVTKWVIASYKMSHFRGRSKLPARQFTVYWSNCYLTFKSAPTEDPVP